MILDIQEDVDEISWQNYKGLLTEKQEKTRDKVIKRLEKVSLFCAFGIFDTLIFLLVFWISPLLPILFLQSNLHTQKNIL